jgi:hypothetical protein
MSKRASKGTTQTSKQQPTEPLSHGIMKNTLSNLCQRFWLIVGFRRTEKVSMDDADHEPFASCSQFSTRSHALFSDTFDMFYSYDLLISYQKYQRK